MTAGPYETEREVRESPAARAAYNAPYDGSSIREANRLMLSETLSAAGISLGAYDTRIMEWLSGWEPQTCAVITSWIARASQT